MEDREYSPAYAASLRVSSMVYPNEFVSKLKYYIFKLYNPMHPFWRDLLLALNLIHHEGRQRYLLGKLKKEKKMDDLLAHLVKNGFGNHFIAWIDEGEIASLRLVKNFEFQYHVRIFKDGEVRGHFEYTPEGHPFGHLNESLLESRRDEFASVLKGWINELEEPVKV